MNWRVRAGPATVVPRAQATGPRIWGSRMPSRLSSPLAVALPIRRRPSIRSFDGRWMSGVSIIVGPLSFVAACATEDGDGTSGCSWPGAREGVVVDVESEAGAIVQHDVPVLDHGLIAGRELVPPRVVDPMPLQHQKIRD